MKHSTPSVSLLASPRHLLLQNFFTVNHIHVNGMTDEVIASFRRFHYSTTDNSPIVLSEGGRYNDISKKKKRSNKANKRHFKSTKSQLPYCRKCSRFWGSHISLHSNFAILWKCRIFNYSVLISRVWVRHILITWQCYFTISRINKDLQKVIIHFNEPSCMIQACFSQLPTLSECITAMKFYLPWKISVKNIAKFWFTFEG